MLDRKQALPSGVDIRSDVLDCRHNACAFSFSSSNLKQQYPRNLTSLFTNTIPSDAPENEISRAKSYFLLGSLVKDDPKVNGGWKPLLKTPSSGDDNTFFIEQGFLASPENWAPQFRSKPESACLGYVYDDIAQYYMANYPNRLIRKLNSGEELGQEELARSRRLVDHIAERKISKYNNQPVTRLTLNDDRRKVLVCDQAYADASTTFGLIDDSGFQRMLETAIAENPDALILVKTHPDTSWQPKNRTGYYNHLENTENLIVLREPVNPFLLFELVDTVYVGTSQMGLEALIAGKKVVCFGAPFFAGWGLTDDRRSIPHRERGRTLEEIFYYFYIWYTIYQVPGKDVPSSVEDALHYLEQHRPVYVAPVPLPAARMPLVSVILPVFGVAPYIEAAIRSAQKQTLYDIEIIPVDDASIDGSAHLVRELALGDKRIRPVFLAKNIGQGFARNEGLKVARGKYIWFLDGDDYFATLEHLEKAVTEALENGADMVRCRKRLERVENSEGIFLRNRLDSTEDFFDRKISGVDFASYPVLLHNRHFWNYLYNKDFLLEAEIFFRTPQWEERTFLLEALLKAKHISSINSDAVVYRIRTDSTARRAKTLDDVEHMVRNFEEAMKLLVKYGANDVDSPLYEHFCFNGSQFIHYIFYGFCSEVLSAKKNRDHKMEYYQRLAVVLQVSNFNHFCISHAPIALNKDWLEEGRYGLIVEALRSDKTQIIDQVLNGDAIDLGFLHNQFIAQPNSHLSAALNTYARNDLVSLAENVAREEPTSQIRVVLHIGSTKTGSTYLQHWLDRNRPQLLSQGVYYPEVGLFRQKGRPHKTAGHAMFTGAATQGDPRLLDHIKAAIGLSKEKIHTVLLSSEAYFLNRHAPKLCDYFHNFDVQMLVYLRRQDSWANSQYCEFVSGGATVRVSDSVDDWLNKLSTKRYLSYNQMLQKWEKCIGVDNITVRPFERSEFKGGTLESDFCDIVGISNPSTLAAVGDKERNTASLNTAYVELLKHLNSSSFKSKSNYFSFIEGVHDVFTRLNKKDASSVQMLTEEQSSRIMQEHAKGNSEIARKYTGVERPLFPDRKGASKSIDRSPSYISDSEMSAVFELLEEHRDSHSKPRSKSDAEVETNYHYNYGPMEWRKKLFVPLLSPLVKATTSEAELENFRIDPAGFVRLSDTWKTRIVRKLFFPART